MAWRTAFSAVLLLSMLGGAATAASVPTPLTGVVVSALAEKDPGTSLFTYRYRLANPPVNSQAVDDYAIELNRRAGDATLSREGLVNGPGYLPFGSADTFARVPMVPVGMVGPDGWIQGLAYDSGTAQRPLPRGLARWHVSDDPFMIAPGQTQQGFLLTSYGLPGIRSAEVTPDIDLESLPEEYEGDPDKVRELELQVVLHAKTVGPTAPPQTFVPLEFLNYLIALLHDSRQQSWIKVDGIHQSLLAKLLAAKRALEGGRVQPAAGELKAFVNEVQAVSCPEFSCPGNKPLTSEAYALLYFNGQYLLERLPASGAR